jgi:hypothetical protein
MRTESVTGENVMDVETHWMWRTTNTFMHKPTNDQETDDVAARCDRMMVSGLRSRETMYSLSVSERYYEYIHTRSHETPRRKREEKEKAMGTTDRLLLVTTSSRK